MVEDKIETMELAIREQAQEQAKTNQLIRDQMTLISLLRNEIAIFSDKLNNQSITVNTDTRPVQEVVDKGILKMSLIVDRAVEKNRTNFWQLFFQSDTPKWAVILAIAITFLTYLYMFCSSLLRK